MGTMAHATVAFHAFVEFQVLNSVPGELTKVLSQPLGQKVTNENSIDSTSHCSLSHNECDSRTLAFKAKESSDLHACTWNLCDVGAGQTNTPDDRERAVGLVNEAAQIAPNE
jgi:hypothetical protein